MRTLVMEKRCPKCGEPLYLLPDGGATNWGVTTYPVLCENCGHVEEVTVIVAEREGE